MDRWGLRRIVLGALALLAASVALTTRMRPQWQLMLFWGVLVGAGTGVTSMVLAAVIATRWFDERRGLVLGVLSAANATGQLVFLPLLASVVESQRLAIGRAWSWPPRRAVVFVIVLLFMRDRPEDIGLRPYGQRRRGLAAAARDRWRRSPRCAMRVAHARVLDPRRHVLRLRREHERTHRHAPHRRLPRLRHSGGARRRSCWR